MIQDNSFDNLETTFGKSTVTQERVSLVASHMYKQYLDFNNAVNNGYRAFMEIEKELEIIADILKKSFAARNIPTQNIYVEKDSEKQTTVVMLNALWLKISFSIRSNIQPTALSREQGAPLLSYRIMAIKGNYKEIMDSADKKQDETSIMLDNEVASLFIPAEKSQPSIMTIKYLANKEFPLSSVDASREFVLKVLETVCGRGNYHKMSLNLGSL